MTHQFAYGGLYNITVTIFNNLNSYTFVHPLIVYGKIGNISLVVQNGPGIALIAGVANCQLIFESPMPPANVQVQFNFDDGSTSAVMAFSMATVSRSLHIPY